MSPEDSSNEREQGIRATQLFGRPLRSNPLKPKLDREPQEPESSSEKSASTEPLTEGEPSPIMPSRERRHLFRFGREASPVKEASHGEGRQAKRRASGAFQVIRNALFSNGREDPQHTSEESRCLPINPNSKDDQFRSPSAPVGSPLKPPSRSNLSSSVPSPISKASPRHLEQKRSPRPIMAPKKNKDATFGNKHSDNTGSETYDITLSQKLIIGHRKGAYQRNGIDDIPSTESNAKNTPSKGDQDPQHLSGERPSLGPTLSQKLMLGNQEIRKKIEERKAPSVHVMSESPEQQATQPHPPVRQDRRSASPSICSRVSSQRSTISHAKHRKSQDSQDDISVRQHERGKASGRSRRGSLPGQVRVKDAPQAVEPKQVSRSGSQGPSKGQTALRHTPSPNDENASRDDWSRHSRLNSKTRSSASQSLKNEPLQSPTIQRKEKDSVSVKSSVAENCRPKKIQHDTKGHHDADRRGSEAMTSTMSRRRSSSLDESLSNRQQPSSDDCVENSTRSEGNMRSKIRAKVSQEQHDETLKLDDLHHSRSTLLDSNSPDASSCTSPHRKAKYGVISSSRYRVPRTPSGKSEQARVRLSPDRKSGVMYTPTKSKSTRSSPAVGRGKVSEAPRISPETYLHMSGDWMGTSSKLTTDHYRSVNMMASRKYQSPFGDHGGDEDPAQEESPPSRHYGRTESPGPLGASERDDGESVARHDRTRALKKQLRTLEKLNASMRSQSPSKFDISDRSEPSSHSRSHHSRSHHSRQNRTRSPRNNHTSRTRNRSRDSCDSDRSSFVQTIPDTESKLEN